MEMAMVVSRSLMNHVDDQLFGGGELSYSILSWEVSKVFSRLRVTVYNISTVAEVNQATAMNLPYGDHGAVATRARW